MRRRARFFFIICLVTWGCTPPRLLAQSHACSADQDVGNSFLASVRLAYSDVRSDSIGWQASDFPFATGEDIQLVTSGPTCSAAVSAINQQYAAWGTQVVVSEVWVVRIGTTGYVVTTNEGAAHGRRPWYYFDEQWVFKQVIQA